MEALTIIGLAEAVAQQVTLIQPEQAVLVVAVEVLLLLQELKGPAVVLCWGVNLLMLADLSPGRYRD